MTESTILIYILVGICAGLVSGFAGVGGGIIIVPALAYFAGFSHLRATGTSLAVLLPPVGIAAVIEYYRHDNVDMRAALIIACCLFIGAWASAFIANQLPQHYLRIGFALFIVIVGCQMLYSELAKFF